MNIQTEAVEIIHGGIIRISGSFWSELFSDVLAVDSVDIQGILRDRGVFKAIHDRLMLPESYAIVGVFYNAMFRYWHIALESPDLPMVAEGMEYPQITPIYVRNEDGSTQLVRIDM